MDTGASQHQTEAIARIRAAYCSREQVRAEFRLDKDERRRSVVLGVGEQEKEPMLLFLWQPRRAARTRWSAQSLRLRNGWRRAPAVTASAAQTTVWTTLVMGAPTSPTATKMGSCINARTSVSVRGGIVADTATSWHVGLVLSSSRRTCRAHDPGPHMER